MDRKNADVDWRFEMNIVIINENLEIAYGGERLWKSYRLKEIMDLLF